MFYRRKYIDEFILNQKKVMRNWWEMQSVQKQLFINGCRHKTQWKLSKLRRKKGKEDGNVRKKNKTYWVALDSFVIGAGLYLYMERQKQMETKASFAFAAAAKNITLRTYVELWTGGLLRQWYQEINVFT